MNVVDKKLSLKLMYLWHIMVISYGMFLKPICAIRIVLAWMIRILKRNWKLCGERKRRRKNLLIHHHLTNLFLHNLHQIPNPLSIQSDLALCFQATPMRNLFLHLKNRQTLKPELSQNLLSNPLLQPLGNLNQNSMKLFWQTRNANAQNQTLKQLEKKIDRFASQVSQTKTKVDSIRHHLDQMYIHL